MLKKEEQYSYNFIDLFAGAGGLSEGFLQAGFKPVAHVEMNEFAAKTLETRSAYYYLKGTDNLGLYKKYLTGKISRDEFMKQIPASITKTIIKETMSDETLPSIFRTIDGIMKIRGISKMDVIVGGPPCQAYSLVGRAQSSHMEVPMAEDPRNYLYKLYARFLKRYQPRMFVFENVTGIESANNGATWKNIQKYLKRVGYEIECREQNARTFGVLQNRRRMIIVGWLKQSGLKYPDFLEIKTDAIVNDLLADLPKLHPGESSDKYARTKASSYVIGSGIRAKDDVLTLHNSRPNIERDINIYRRAIELWNDGHKRLNYNDLPDELKTHKNRHSFTDMSDFPWKWWVHRGNLDCNGTLKMYSTGNTSTLADMWVECSCGAKRSMNGATQRENFEDIACPGHHPFRPSVKNQRCNKPVIPSQRGASNVYFAVSRSAISIPPWINPLYNLIDEHLRDIELAKQLMGDEGITKIYEMYFSAYTRNEFDEALERRMSNIKEFTEIKQMEYNAITHHNDPAYESNKKHFKAEEDALPGYLQKYFSRIIRVTRLREVRVLLGFTRVEAPDPDADEQPNVVALSKGKQERWLPAAEVNGEGIFIEFNKDTLAAWLNSPAVKGLSQKYSDSYREFCESKGWTITVVRNAVYVLMHTFAHLMIKQMSMSSGYSSSAIRERIYFGDKMSGILLYTGSSDKEGSLGGLVELGNIDQMTNLMRDAFQEALVCTNDPECMSNLPAGKNSNGAACHSCCMISETACENGNRMLDRGLVVPIPEREECSYFKELVSELCQVEI